MEIVFRTDSHARAIHERPHLVAIHTQHSIMFPIWFRNWGQRCHTRSLLSNDRLASVAPHRTRQRGGGGPKSYVAIDTHRKRRTTTAVAYLYLRHRPENMVAGETFGLLVVAGIGSLFMAMANTSPKSPARRPATNTSRRVHLSSATIQTSHSVREPASRRPTRS